LEYIEIGRVWGKKFGRTNGGYLREYLALWISAHHAYAWVWGYHKTYHAAISSTRKVCNRLLDVDLLHGHVNMSQIFSNRNEAHLFIFGMVRGRARRAPASRGSFMRVENDATKEPGSPFY
jgi:hypothetical protein